LDYGRQAPKFENLFDKFSYNKFIRRSLGEGGEITMKIKKGDNVKILVGKDRGKTGKVLSLVKKSKKGKVENQVVVEGLNLRYKHLRPRRQGEKGQRIMFPAPMNISDVMLKCPKCGKFTRVEYKLRDKKVETSKEMKLRVCKKCKAVI